LLATATVMVLIVGSLGALLAILAAPFMFHNERYQMVVVQAGGQRLILDIVEVEGSGISGQREWRLFMVEDGEEKRAHAFFLEPYDR